MSLLFGIFSENKILMSIRSYTVALFSLFIIIFAGTGCQKKCKVCDYATSCYNGYCYCPNGYEGDSCKILSATKFLHSYTVSDPCSGSSNYVVTIYANDPNYPNVLSIYNLFNTGQYVEADIHSNANKQGVDIILPDNANNNLGAFSVSGQGLYQTIGNGYARITIQVDYLSGGLDKQCTLILTQQ